MIEQNLSDKHMLDFQQKQSISRILFDGNIFVLKSNELFCTKDQVFDEL